MKNATINKSIWLKIFILIGVIIVPVMSLRYFSFDTVGVLNLKSPDLINHLIYRLGFYLHIGGGMVALMVGCIQLSPALRRRKMALHRRLGRIYGYAVGTSGLAALSIAPWTYGGIIAATGLSMLGLLWLITTYLGVHAIRQKDLARHQRWILRSYALTFSAVTFRIILVSLPLMGISFLTTYQIAAWLPWIINLSFIEWYLSRRNISVRETP